MADWEFDDVGGQGKIFFMDTNLSSPILVTELDDTRQLFVDTISSNDKDYFYDLDWRRRNNVTFFRKLCKVKGWTSKFLSGMNRLEPEEYEEIEKAMMNERLNVESDYIEAAHLCQDIENALCAGLSARGLPEEEIKGTSALLMSDEALPFRTAYEEFSDLFGRTESRVRKSEYAWTRGSVGSVTIWITPKHAIIETSGKFRYSSTNQVLMLKDKIATRFMLLEHVAPLGLDLNLRQHLLDLFEWQDATLTLYGNQAYNILKAVEPMYKTRLSHVVDNIFGDDTAYTRMIAKMDEKEETIRRVTGIRGHKRMKTLQMLVERTEGVRNIVEMFGCLKSCGHPIIDPRLGGLSAAAEARSPDLTSIVDAQALRNTFCHTVLVAYVKKHGRWPKLTHTKAGTILRRLNDRQERNLDYNSYPFEDWTTTEWTKILDFDFFPNFLELMDDKSISFYRSDIALSWDHDRKPSSQRRLLLELMNREGIDIKGIIEKVSRREVPFDWFVVSLYPKEREFKIEPRMFAMLILEMRCFFTAIEANIADGLFRYLPQQTMTKTKTQNQERFLAFTDPAKQSGNHTLFLEIDLSRWNLRWRELVIHMLGHDLNMMFGMPGTFTVTHWFFRQSQIVVRVPGLRPEGIEQPYPPVTSLAWDQHLGGFEGLNQKLWTAATYAMVEMGLIPLLKDGTISSYELIGQGDNQVVRLSIPSQDEPPEVAVPNVRDRANAALESACRSVNQIVKPDENIESTSVLTYSKDVYVQGVEYPTSLKKHSRLFPVTSTDFPSVAGNARAILSGAVAGGENAMHPLRSSLIGCYHAIRYLRSATRGMSIHGTDFPKLTDVELIACMVLPASIGGLAGLNFASFFYKGGSDPLGKEISGMRMLSCGLSVASRLCSTSLRALEEKYHIEEDPDLTTLIDNPYALPLAKTASPLSKVGRLTLAAFRPKVLNHEIKPLLSERVLKEEEILKQDLISITPLNPILLHDLYEASGFGTIRLMRKMFVHTRTVQTVAQWVNPDITHIFLRADLNDVLSFRDWLKGLPRRGYSGKSSFELSNRFRSYWGANIQGVSSYQPLDFVHKVDSTRSPSSIKWSAHSHKDLLHTRGPLSGYVGTATREKRSEHGYKIVDTGAPSRSVTKLQLIRSQAYGDKSFNKLLDNIAFTRSPVRLSDITEYLPKVVGGSIIHRLASVIRSMAASYVGPLNFVTHIRIDTDSLGVISGSALNYPIMIQEYIVVAQAGAKLNYMYRNAQSGELLFDAADLIPLPEDTLACPPPLFSDVNLPKSVLLYSETLNLTRTYDNVAMSVPRHAIVVPTEYESIDRIFDSFVGFFVVTLRDQGRAKTIADTRGSASIPARFSLDIAEAHAVGPMFIIKSIAYAIVITSLRDTFRTLQMHPERWDEAMFMVHNINVCLKACSSYWNHPMFQNHKDYPRLRSSRLRYGQEGNQFSRLEANVRRQISSIMTSVDDKFWKTKTPVFAGENQTQIPEAMMIEGAKSVMHVRMTGDPKANLFSSLYSGYMRLPKGITQSSPNIIDLLRTKFLGLSRAVKKQGDFLLGEDFEKIGDIKRVRVFNDDIRTVMRNARSLAPEIRQSIVAKLRPTIRNFHTASDHCERCLPPERQTHTVLWNRYKQRRHGGISSAGYTWLPILSIMSVSKTALVVGNGNGGLADLLITSYNVDIIGLDLESDMPRDSATLLNYMPIGLQINNKSRFIQSDWSINSTGDWTDLNVVTLVLDSLPTITTVFIDATGPLSSSLTDSVKTTMNHKLVSNCYVRLIDTQEDLTKSLSCLHSLFEVRSWVVSRTFSQLEIICEISRSRLPVHSCTNAPCLVDMDLSEDMHSVIPERNGELLEAATLHCLSWNGETLLESFWAMKNLCQSLLNKSRSQQLKYRQRYALMIGYATMVAVVADNPRYQIQEWISDERITTDLFTYDIRESTTTHLLRYVARLSSLRDSSTLFFS